MDHVEGAVTKNRLTDLNNPLFAQHRGRVMFEDYETSGSGYGDG